MPRDLLADNPKPRDLLASPEDKPWYEDTADFLKANMELPAGIAGGIGGALTGAAVAGPVGMVVGGVLGGSGGSFGGSLASDALQGEELDYADAVKEAAISAGFDVATLGLGKVLKPAYVAAKMKLGYSPAEVVEEVVKRQAGPAGTKESLQATQEILQKEGATLTPFQTGEASGSQIFAQRIAETGMFSRNVMEQNVEAVNNAISKSLEDIISKGFAGPLDSSTLGMTFSEVIGEGKKALGKQYEMGLSNVLEDVAGKAVSMKPLKAQLTSFVNRGDRQFFNTLDKDTQKYVNSLVNGLDNVENVPASVLIDFEKKIKSQMRQFGDINSGVYNGTAERELGMLSNEIRNTVSSMLAKVSPEAAEKYSKLNKAYAKGMTGLLPEINSNFVKRANKDNFYSLGNMLIGGQNTDQIANMFKSIDKAYSLVGKEGAKTLPFATAKEAKQAVRSSYLAKVIPTLSSPAFNIEDYAKLSAKLNTPTEARRVSAILGEDYSTYKQLLNAMTEASKKPESELGTLLVRGKEFAAFSQAAAAGAGAASMTPAGALGAAAVFGIPVFMAKMSTNPKAVNKLLALSKTPFTSAEKASKHLQLIVGDVVNAMDEEEKSQFDRYYPSE